MMHFTDFDLEDEERGNCMDHVIVNEDQAPTDKICGKMSGGKFQTHANRTFYANTELKIKMYAIGSFTSKGFRAVFKLGE